MKTISMKLAIVHLMDDSSMSKIDTKNLLTVFLDVLMQFYHQYNRKPVGETPLETVCSVTCYKQVNDTYLFVLSRVPEFDKIAGIELRFSTVISTNEFMNWLVGSDTAQVMEYIEEPGCPFILDFTM